MLSKARHIVIAFIDFFYKPFARFIPLQTFRYLACGGSNTVLNWLVYSISFNIVLNQQSTHIIDDIFITAHVGAYIIAFCITFPLGFILSRYVVFPESNLHGRKQFFRYVLTTATFILLTYVLIKLFAIMLPMVRADISYIFIMVITAVLSYLSQRFYTFKSDEDESDALGE
ncbi:MAG: GtrA family protein [Taibaiella sp.]|nr:GtrA family protein [Taibaiella sp.]